MRQVPEGYIDGLGPFDVPVSLLSKVEDCRTADTGAEVGAGAGDALEAEVGARVVTRGRRSCRTTGNGKARKVEYCLADCPLGGVSNADMVGCDGCDNWVHTSCALQAARDLGTEELPSRAVHWRPTFTESFGEVGLESTTFHQVLLTREKYYCPICVARGLDSSDSAAAPSGIGVDVLEQQEQERAHEDQQDVEEAGGDAAAVSAAAQYRALALIPKPASHLMMHPEMNPPGLTPKAYGIPRCGRAIWVHRLDRMPLPTAGPPYRCPAAVPHGA